jgi:translation initiation factor RLI1
MMFFSYPSFIHRPEALLTGMNRFLAALDVTFRRDPTNFRPRVNKHKSVKDQEQKASGNYFFLECVLLPSLFAIFFIPND